MLLWWLAVISVVQVVCIYVLKISRYILHLYALPTLLMSQAFENMT